jgi:hypothetical protein
VSANLAGGRSSRWPAAGAGAGRFFLQSLALALAGPDGSWATGTGTGARQGMGLEFFFRWVTPVVGGRVRGQKRTWDRFIFRCALLCVFTFYSPHRETTKNMTKQIQENIGFRFFCKKLSTRLFCKTFFELPS